MAQRRPNQGSYHKNCIVNTSNAETQSVDGKLGKSRGKIIPASKTPSQNEVNGEEHGKSSPRPTDNGNKNNNSTTGYFRSSNRPIPSGTQGNRKCGKATELQLMNSDPPKETSEEEERQPTDGENNIPVKPKMTDESSPEEYPPESSSAQSSGADVSDNVEIKRLEAQIAKQEKVKEDFGKQIKEKNLEIKRLEEETNRLQKEVLQNIASPDVAKLELERQNLKKLCDELISEKKDLQKRLEEAEDEIEELRKKLTQTRKEGNQRTEKLLGELDRTKSELDHTKRRLTQAELDLLRAADR